MEAKLLIPVFACYGLALVLHLLPWPRARLAGKIVFGIGWAGNAFASVARGVSAGHLPFSNMYETMLTLAAFAFPLAAVSERIRRVPGGFIDPLIALAILFPSAFHLGDSFSGEIRRLPPALQSPFFLPHVVSYLVAYTAMARAFLFSVRGVFSGEEEARKKAEREAYFNAALGFPLLTLGLLLGAFWAKYAWGDYWSWDPKEVWSLVSWFVFLLYFHVRSLGGRSPGWSAVLLTAGFAAIVVTLLVVNLTPLFGGLHAYA
jgi:ABC-type transport system involved in cytochrome c biogenesis permease subunit